MKKSILAALFISAFALNAMAQTDIVISKDEFVENQLKMMEQVKQAQAEMTDSTDKLMKDKLPPAEYEQYKKDLQAEQSQQEVKVADCLGIPAEDIPGLSEKMGPDFQISVIKSCSKKLPETVNIGSENMMNSPEFAAYMGCAEAMVAKEVGVSPSKLKQCSAMAAEL